MAVRPRFMLFAFFALALALSGVALAQEGGGKQAKSTTPQESKKTTAKQAKGTSASKAKGKAAAPAVSPEVVEQEFQAFAVAWMDKIGANAICTSAKKEILSRNGRYVARYNEADRSSTIAEIQTTTSTMTPYTGTIRYLENVYECEADTPEAAELGPFVTVKTTPTTEIFRYTNKKWLY